MRTNIYKNQFEYENMSFNVINLHLKASLKTAKRHFFACQSLKWKVLLFIFKRATIFNTFRLNILLNNISNSLFKLLKDTSNVLMVQIYQEIIFFKKHFTKNLKLFLFYDSYGFKSCFEMAKAIVDNIEKDNDAIEKVEFSQMGKGDPAKSGFFLNIHLKNSFI